MADPDPHELTIDHGNGYVARRRPMVSEVVPALFQPRITSRVERAFGRALHEGRP